MKETEFCTAYSTEEAKLIFRNFFKSLAIKDYLDSVKGHEIDFDSLLKRAGIVIAYQEIDLWKRLETDNPPVTEQEFFEMVFNGESIANNTILIWTLESWETTGKGAVFEVKGRNIIPFAEKYPEVSFMKTPFTFINQSSYVFYVIENGQLIFIHKHGYRGECVLPE